MNDNILEVPSAVGLKATFASGWVEVLYRVAIYRGLNAQQLFEEAGIETHRASHVETRYPAHKFKPIWERAAHLTGDPAFGLSAANVAFPTMYHSLSVAMSASACLQDAFDRLIRYHHIIDTLSINTLTQYSDGKKFTWSPVPRYESEVGAEAFVSSLIALCRWCYGPDFTPAKVTLVKDEVAGESYRNFFGAPVEFNATENAIYLDQKTLMQPLMTANRQLAISSERLSADYLARLNTEDLVNRVYNKLLEYISKRSYSEDIIAEELNMSLRSMQRKLQQAGTSFEALLQSVRRNLALHYINDHQISLKEVGCMLGFTDPSNFGRAFKRWTGLTPGEYRQAK